MSWPIFECFISRWWRETKKLTEILIAKEPPFGGVVTSVFLVDLGCLGLKQGFVSQFRTRSEYEANFRTMMMARNPMIQVEYPLVAQIIKESMRYAHELGFEPSEHAQKALQVLGPLEMADECGEEIPLGGEDGKPFYAAGPHDDIDYIMNILIPQCGHGNFNFIVPEGPMPSGFFD